MHESVHISRDPALRLPLTPLVSPSLPPADFTSHYYQSGLLPPLLPHKIPPRCNRQILLRSNRAECGTTKLAI